MLRNEAGDRLDYLLRDSYKMAVLQRIIQFPPTFAKETCAKHEGFYMKAEKEALQIIEQEDTYYDTKDFALHKAN